MNKKTAHLTLIMNFIVKIFSLDNFNHSYCHKNKQFVHLFNGFYAAKCFYFR